MGSLARKIKRYFGIDAASDIHFGYLICPKRFYNVLKYILNKKKYSVKVPYYPITLMVEVSTVCNLQCPGCERELYKRDPAQGGIPKENVRLENLKKLEKILPYVYSTYFVGELGDPFLNKEFCDIHRFFKKFNIKTGYFSNAMLLTEEHIKKTFEEKMDSVLVSIDSHIKERYESIKQGSNFEKVVDNISKFSLYKKKTGRSGFQFGLNFIFRSDNYKDILGYLDFAYSIGADFIHSSSFITHIEEEKETSFFLVDNREKEEIFRRAREKAERLGISVRLPAIAPHDDCLCNCLWHGVCVFYNGDVCACPYFRTDREFYYHVNAEKEVFYEKKDCRNTVLGNYLTQDFCEEIWNGPKARALREAELGKDLDFNPCGSCYYKYELH